jgi:ribonuclease HI
MQKTLRIADEFYQVNDIEINTSKTKVIAINTHPDSIQESVQFGNPPINLKVEGKGSGVRVLGVWLSADGRLRTHRDKMREKVDLVATAISRKRISDKQATYIVRALLIPALEYMMTICILSKTECSALEQRYMAILKHKAEMARSAPNCVLRHNNLYDVPSLWAVQCQSQIPNLLLRLQDQGLMGYTTMLRVAALQIQRADPNSIFENPSPAPSRHGHSIIGKILELMHDTGINFIKADAAIAEAGCPADYGTSIAESIDNWARMGKIERNLQDRRLWYTAQLLDSSGTQLLQWDTLRKHLPGNTKSTPPKWFGKLENWLIAPQAGHRRIRRQGSDQIQVEKFRTRLPTVIRHEFCEGDWVISFNESGEHTLGWVSQVVLPDTESTPEDPASGVEYVLQHWRRTKLEDDPPGSDSDEEGSGRYAWSNPTNTFIHCEGCPGYDDIRGHCLWTEPEESLAAAYVLGQDFITTTFDSGLFTERVVSTVHINTEKTDIAAARQAATGTTDRQQDRGEQEHAEDAEELHSGHSSPQPAPEGVLSRWCQDIVDRAEGFLQVTPAHFSFERVEQCSLQYRRVMAFTDGSLVDADSPNVRAGIGWHIVEGWATGLTYSAGLSGPISSTRAELMAVISLAAAVPSGTTLRIKTDSQNVAHGFNINIMQGQRLTLRKRLRQKFWQEWSTLRDIMEERQITVTISWVKAHVGIDENEVADALAKKGLDLPPAALKRQSTADFDRFPTIGGIILADDVRGAIAQVHKIRAGIEWQNTAEMLRLTKEVGHGRVDWQETFKGVHGGSGIRAGTTTMRDSHRRAYRVKALMGLLPTQSWLGRRQPAVYTDVGCPRCCAEKETNHHLWSCKVTQNERRDAVREGKRAWLEAIKKQKRTVAGQSAIEQKAASIFRIHRETSPDGEFGIRDMVGQEGPMPVEYILRGFAPKSWIEQTAALGIRMEVARHVVSTSLEAVVTHGWKHIWIPRCAAQATWEKQQGITARAKQGRQQATRCRRKKIRRRKVVGLVGRWLQGDVCRCGWSPEEHTDRGCSPYGQRAQQAVSIYVDSVCRRSRVGLVETGVVR